MNFRKRQRIASEVSTHSLNDIMFFLLLFFLITSTMVNPNIMKLMLPKAAANSAKSPRNATVSIDKDKKFYFNKKEVNIENLQGLLQAELEGTLEPVILVAADENVDWGSIVKVMSIGKKLNAKVLAATQVEK